MVAKLKNALELVVVNFSGTLTRKKVQGRWYYVTNSVLIVPGVLPGSQGPLLYRPEDIALNYQSWNGMPIVVWHPTGDDNLPITARQPSVLDKFQIGYVYNAEIRKDGALVAETWFDEELTRQFDVHLPSAYRITPRLLAGDSIELSTGLYTDNYPAPEGAVYNGKKGPIQYTHVARNYRPDHLAVLPDQVGACSVTDGCGVNIRNAKDYPRPIKPGKACEILKDGEAWGHKLSAKQQRLMGVFCDKAKKGKKKKKSVTRNRRSVMALSRAKKIQALVTNCKCYKKMAAVLNGMSDQDIDELHDREVVLNTIQDALGDPYKKATKKALTVNAMPAYLTSILVDNDDDSLADEDDSDDDGDIDAELDDDGDDDGDEEAEAPKKRQTVSNKGKAAPKKKATENEDEEDYPEDGKKKGKKPTANVSVDEWLKTAPPQVREVVLNSIKDQKNQKYELVGKLVANIKNKAARKEAATAYLKLSLNELRKLPLPEAKEEDTDVDGSPADFFNSMWGKQGGPSNRTDNSGGDKPDTQEPPLEIPVLTYANPSQKKSG